MNEFKKVAVLAGGPSSERDISLTSGEAVHKALTGQGINAVFVDVGGDIEKAVSSCGFDAAFIALHGGFGEDGTVQTILDTLGIPYTGSGPAASRLAIDKIASRGVFRSAGIVVPACKVLDKRKKARISDIRFPAVVKPQSEGSSVGLSIASCEKTLCEAMDKAFSYGEKILVERFIKGREITVGILDDKPLPVVEIVHEGDLYDYNAKYESKKTEYLVPAPIDRLDFKRAKEAGQKAHKALGCRYFSRVDMILAEDGRIYVLEVNTIPGLTSRSLLPKAAASAGIDFPQLCRNILEASAVTETKEGVLNESRPSIKKAGRKEGRDEEQERD